MSNSSTIRYCKKCQCDTLHDTRIEHLSGEPFTGLGRVFVAIVTVGISEAGADKFHVCQRCGTKTVKA